MNVEFDKSFSKSIDNLNNKTVANKIADFIEKCEDADSLKSLTNIKKLKGFKNYYRYKTGDYRVGFELIDETIHFIIVSHRKDIYKKFP